MVELVKRASVEAVEASKPVHLLFGQVVSTGPLKVQVDQKTIYTEKMLILTRNVTDYQVDITVNMVSEPRSGGSGAEAYESHTHDIRGRKKITVHNALQVGDWVLLGRIQKGKRFMVLDRIKGVPGLSGEG